MTRKQKQLWTAALLLFASFMILLTITCILIVDPKPTYSNSNTCSTPNFIPPATITQTPTASPTQQSANPATCQPNSQVTIIYQASTLSAQDVLYLSALCVVETKSFREQRADACRSVVSTVLTRMRVQVLSDGTVSGTLTHNCNPGDLACQFPAYVVNGCKGISLSSCPYNYPKELVFYSGVVEDYLSGKTRPSCKGFLYYDLSDIEVDCRIEENGQYINFHEGPHATP